MQVHLRYTSLLLLFQLPSLLFAQELAKDYFISPTKKKIQISSNFGELRANHFHTGIDIKVPHTGTALYAPADGYVARISVSPWGYGNALYIAHPNGYTTVYGHLNRYSKKVAQYVKQQQYQKQSFKINLYPQPEELRFKQGEIIGYAGNTGHSFGTHLHFEIRNTLTEEVLNPALFGFTIQDNIRPKFLTVGIYPLTKSSKVNGKNSPNYLKTKGQGRLFTTQGKTVSVSGKIGFSFSANDYMSSVHNKCGIFQSELKIDGQLVYKHKMRGLFFNQSRAINSLIDYPYYKENKKRLQKCYSEPGNTLRIYEKKHEGFYFNDNKTHKIEIIISDFYHNKTTLRFYAKSKKQPKKTTHTACKSDVKFDKTHSIIEPDFRLTITKNSLYKNICLNYYEEKTTQKRFQSSIFHVHNNNEPIHKALTVSLRAKGIPPNLLKKTSIVYISPKGGISWVDAKYIDGFFTGKSKNFGKFTLMADTVPPKIKPKKFTKGTNKKVGNKIAFKVTDNLSGVESYNGYIDGQWVLFQFDGKNKLFFISSIIILNLGKIMNLKLCLPIKKTTKQFSNQLFLNKLHNFAKRNSLVPNY